MLPDERLNIPPRVWMSPSDSKRAKISLLKLSIYKSNSLLNPNGEYKLHIIVPGLEKDINSSTELINELTVKKPLSGRKISFSNPLSSVDTEWESTENAKIYELTVRLNYTEINGGDTTEKYIDWVQPTRIATDVSGGESMYQELTGLGFYNFVSTAVGLY